MKRENISKPKFKVNESPALETVKQRYFEENIAILSFSFFFKFFFLIP